MPIRSILVGLILLGVGIYALTNFTDSAVHLIMRWPFILGGALILIAGIVRLFRRAP